MEKLIKKHNNDIRLVKQFVYDPREEQNNFYGCEDVANDNAINKIDGLYHRYPTKVLIFPTEVCFGECRFCFRKHIRDKEKVLSADKFEKIKDYLKSNPQINEVIFSGGDPLTVNNKDLIKMISEINAIKSIQIIRIHTRALSYDPTRIDDELINFLKTVQPLFMVFHVDSALELSKESCKVANKLADNGIMCFSQTALLHEVNDTEKDLKELFIKLITNRIKPYYLFHPDQVKGNDHFYVPLQKGIDLYKSLFNHISGLATPIYLLNIPNGGGHCLVDLDNIRKQSDNTYIVKDWEGNETIYFEN